MNRRDTVVALLALGVTGAARRVVAQAGRRKMRIGIMIGGTPEATDHLVTAFSRRMTEFGWIESSTVEYLVRYAGGDTKLHGTIAAEVLAQKVDLVVAPFGPVALEAMKLTKDVPIVFCIVADPVAIGLVTSLGRPGGNVTGVTTGGRELIAKRIQILKEMVPSIRRLGILQGPVVPSHVLAEIAELRRAAKMFGIETIVAKREPAESDDFTNALNRLLREGVDATVGTTSLHWSRRKEFPGLVTKARLPAIYDAEEFVDDGGLISISASYVDRYRAAASHVDRILRGARPQDLPVEEPTIFTIVINLKTAKALGLKIPQSVLIRADRVIE
jgi:ABC-type uncharacterized transport system substrate-binding protein